MGGYTKDFDSLMIMADEVVEFLYSEGQVNYSDVVEELAARLKNIAPHINAERFEGE